MGILEKIFGNKKDSELGELSIYLPDVEIKNTNKTNYKDVLAGIIIGDLIGNKFLDNDIDGNVEFMPLFDNNEEVSNITIMTIATICAVNEIIEGKLKSEREIMDVFTKQYKKFFNEYSKFHYDENFYRWALGKNMKSYNNDCSIIAKACIIGVMFENITDVIKISSLCAKTLYCSRECEKGLIVSAVLLYLKAHNIRSSEIKKYFNKNYPSGKNEINAEISWNQLIEFSFSKKTVSDDADIIVVEAFDNCLNSINFNDCMRNGIRYKSKRNIVIPLSGAFAGVQYSEPSVDRIPIKNIIERKLSADLKKYL